MADYRLYPATNGPGAPASDSTSYTRGVEFYVTADADLTGYWWWCANGAGTAPQVHQLWQVATGTTGSAVAGTTVTMDGAPIYELAPFSYLYQSGLVLGVVA